MAPESQTDRAAETAELLEAAAAHLRAGQVTLPVGLLRRAVRALGIFDAPGQPEELPEALLEELDPATRGIALQCYAATHRDAVRILKVDLETAGDLAAREAHDQGFMLLPPAAWRAALGRRLWRMLDALGEDIAGQVGELAELLNAPPEITILRAVQEKLQRERAGPDRSEVPQP